jgi:ORF6N domain
MKDPITAEQIERVIVLIRGHKVMLDRDLAELYRVEVKQLKRQVKRNQDRFPADFMFELSKEEYDALRSQFGTLKRGEHFKYFLTLLQNRALRCFRVCCGVREPCRSILK